MSYVALQYMYNVNQCDSSSFLFHTDGVCWPKLLKCQKLTYANSIKEAKITKGLTQKIGKSHQKRYLH